MAKSLAERFAAKIGQSPTGCWPWLGFVDKVGYGRIRSEGGRSGESAYAHRVSYALHVAPIPEGTEIDHLCGVRSCVNPEHLEAVSHTENVQRGAAALATRTGRCSRGHDISVHGYFRNGRYHHCNECRRLRRAGVAPATEREAQKTIIDLARTLGWRVAHFRPAVTSKGWRTPVEADGAGFPDLVLVRDRVIFAELKREGESPRPNQVEWLNALSRAGAEVYVWTLADYDEIASILSRRVPRPESAS